MPKCTWRCKHCDDLFWSKSTRDRHIACVHSDERPHACKHCDKKFKRHDTMLVHERTHAPGHGFRCSHCDKKYKSVRALRRHEKKEGHEYMPPSYGSWNMGDLFTVAAPLAQVPQEPRVPQVPPPIIDGAARREQRIQHALRVADYYFGPRAGANELFGPPRGNAGPAN